MAKRDIFIYYSDIGGNIKGVSAAVLPELEDKFLKISVPWELGIGFLKGSENVGSWCIDYDRGNLKKPVLVKKENISLDLNFRLVDNYMKFIPEISRRSRDLKGRLLEADIIIDTQGAEIKIMAGQTLKDNFKLPESTRSSIYSVNLSGERNLDLFFTTRNDPSFLIQHIKVPVMDVINHSEVVRQSPKPLEETSLFTKPIFNNYILVR